MAFFILPLFLMSTTAIAQSLPFESHGGFMLSPFQTIPYNTVPELIVASSPTTCINSALQWQVSYDGINFTDIPGAAFVSYQPPAVNVDVIYYRRACFCGPGVRREMRITDVATINTVQIGPPGVEAASSAVGDENLNMNWVRERSFNGAGNIMNEQKNFFDNNGHLLQSQARVKYRKSSSETYTHVIASQSVNDVIGRPVLTTMPAPIDNSEFKYKSTFVTNKNNQRYSYRDFDKYTVLVSGMFATPVDNTLTPVGMGVGKGTLGWYYSLFNNWEPYTATTTVPYSRTTIYEDGTGNVKESAGVGEAFKIGTGHYGRTFITPVNNELQHYLNVRKKFFTDDEVGARPDKLFGGAMQTVSRDPNGKEIISIADNKGQVLMTARAAQTAGELSVVNQISLGGLTYEYKFNADAASFDSYRLSGVGGNVKVYKYSYQDNVDPVLVYDGVIANSISIEKGNSFYYKVVSAQSFTAKLDGYIPVILPGAPGQTYYLVSSVCSGCLAVPADINRIYYFHLFKTTNVAVAGADWQLYNMDESPVNALSFTSGSALQPGYYKITAKDAPVSVSYTVAYSDVSYRFYNQLGKPVASIAPEGVKKLYGSNIDLYSNKNQLPFISLLEYDVQGRLVKSKEPDADAANEFVYRKDGRLRFSRSAVQLLEGKGKFSYTNYDKSGRIIENGEYEPGTGGIAFSSDMSVAGGMKNILENVGATDGLINGTKRDVSATYYDVVDNSHSQNGYTQDINYMGGAVSSTAKFSSISGGTSTLVSRTWYNYDEEGKTLWTIKYIAGLGYKTTDFSYDPLGNLVKKIFQKNVSTETFVHYYDYDPANMQLWKVYTNTTDNAATRQLQATYVYYLHGPLKRVELAGNLQGIDYTYTVQGTLKAINNSNNTADPGGDGVAGSAYYPDAFGMVLDYYSNDYSNTRNGVQVIKGVNSSAIAGDSYSGQVRAMTWFSKKPASVPGLDAPTTNVFKYDDKYQFTENVWGTGLNFGNTPATFDATGYNKELAGSSGNPAYDANGNILSLQRTGTTGSVTDNFTYTYQANTNKLSVINQVNGGVFASYSYDKLGRLESEARSGVYKYIRYDASGQVTAVSRNANFTQLVAEFVYDEGGSRIAKKSYNSSGQLATVTYYTGGVVYTQNILGGGQPVADEYQLDGGSGRLGVFFRQSGVYAYELNDHLGNVRAVVARNASGYEVRTYTDYYPYGMVLRAGGPNYRYGYQGQYAEKDGETDWNAFELRMYDSRVARWLTVDPMGQYHSPYLAMGNNPVSQIDPDGGQSYSTFIDCDGNVVGGTIADGDIGIYQVNGLTRDNFDVSKINQYKQMGNLVGISFSLYSFRYEEGSNIEKDRWIGHIDLGSYAHFNFLDKYILGNTPRIDGYVSRWQAYDYKIYGWDKHNKRGESFDNYKYRGSQILPFVYASARDAGNIAAGYVAGHDGVSWEVTQWVFERKQAIQGGFKQFLFGSGTEVIQTLVAERFGWEMGWKNRVQLTGTPPGAVSRRITNFVW